MTKQLRAAGVDIPYGNLAIDEGTAQSMGSDATGIFIAASYLTAIETPENRSFLDAMAAQFGDELKTPNDLSVPQYDAIHLYKLAVEAAGSTDPEAVIDALDDVVFTGPRGTIQMDKQRHAPLTMYLGQVQPDGSVEVIKSFEAVDPGEQCPQFAG